MAALRLASQARSPHTAKWTALAPGAALFVPSKTDFLKEKSLVKTGLGARPGISQRPRQRSRPPVPGRSPSSRYHRAEPACLGRIHEDPERVPTTPLVGSKRRPPRAWAAGESMPRGYMAPVRHLTMRAYCLLIVPPVDRRDCMWEDHLSCDCAMVDF